MPKVTEAHLEARREQILDAAAECFARKGFHRSTMHDICQMAELSPGAVYRYFRSKDEIIEAMEEQGRQHSAAIIDAVTSERTDTLDVLEGLWMSFSASLKTCETARCTSNCGRRRLAIRGSRRLLSASTKAFARPS